MIEKRRRIIDLIRHQDGSEFNLYQKMEFLQSKIKRYFTYLRQ